MEFHAYLSRPQNEDSFFYSKQAPAKHWCFTYYPQLEGESIAPDYYFESYELDFRKHILAFFDKKIDYLVFQPEICPDTNHVHFQGYIEFLTQERMSALKKFDDKIHWEKRKGTRDQARNYCMDTTKPHPEGTLPFEFGIWHPGAIRKGNLEEAVNAYKEGKTLLEIAEEMPVSYARYARQLNDLASVTKRPRQVPPEVILLYGPTGSGKSYKAREIAGERSLWTNPLELSGNFWFDGYAGHECALLDDFDGRLSGFKLRNLLQLLDEYALLVPVKGRFVWWEPKLIFVTTNFHPAEWYDWSQRAKQFPALARRFTSVIHWFSGEHMDFCRIDRLVSPTQWESWWFKFPRGLAGAEGPGPLPAKAHLLGYDDYNWEGVQRV